MNSKESRAQIIVAALLEQDKVSGYNMHSRIPGVFTPAREVASDPRWRGSIAPGGRIFVGWMTREQIGERYQLEDGCMVVEITVFGKRRLAANVRGPEIEIFFYEPGFWEAWFGADHGNDSISYSAMIMPNDRDPAWLALRDSPDFQIPPLRDTPPVNPDDSHRRKKRPKRLLGAAYA